MARLVVESGPDAGMVFPLLQPVSTIGRSVANGVQVIDRRMSRQHAEVILEGSLAKLRDLSSRNGTYLNDEKIEGIVILQPGDHIKIGETTFVFEQEKTPDTRPGDTTSKSFRLVDEKQWGRTAGKVRAGADPHLAVHVDTGEGEILKDSHRRLEIIYQVADAIRSILNIEELLQKIMDIIFSVVQPDRGYILLHEATPEDQMVPHIVKRRDGRVEDEVQISGSIVQKCVADRSALLVTDAASDQRFSASESIVLNRIRSAMCAPMIFKDEVLGVIYVDTQSRIVSYSKEELELLTGIANQSATAIMNAKLHSQLIEQHKLAREMEIARSIQINLLPKVYPAIANYDISAMSLPAKQVGGDYYDFSELPENNVGFAIADVSGKGVPAAFLTTLTRSYLRSEGRRIDTGIADLLTSINRLIHADIANDMYVTMIYGILDPKSGNFHYVNAGHAHPLLITPSEKKVVRLEKGGPFLGIFEEVEYEEGEVVIQPNDILLLYTDGVTDIQNSDLEHWGRENLEQLVLGLDNMSAEELRNAIYQACLDFKGEADLFDDFTLIVIKRTEESEDDSD